jgi:hypothetical protein
MSSTVAFFSVLNAEATNSIVSVFIITTGFLPLLPPIEVPG